MVEISKNIGATEVIELPKNQFRGVAAIGCRQDVVEGLRVNLSLCSIDFQHTSEHNAVWRDTLNNSDVNFSAKMSFFQIVHRLNFASSHVSLLLSWLLYWTQMFRAARLQS